MTGCRFQIPTPTMQTKPVLYKTYTLQNPFIEREHFDIQKWTKKYIVLIILYIFTIILATNYFRDKNKIDKVGVFVLARVYKITEYRTATHCSKYEYFFRKQRFVGESCGNFDHVGEFYFLKLMPSDPTNHYELEFTHVPNCLTMDSVPDDGWKALPFDNCK